MQLLQKVVTALTGVGSWSFSLVCDSCEASFVYLLGLVSLMTVSLFFQCSFGAVKAGPEKAPTIRTDLELLGFPGGGMWWDKEQPLSVMGRQRCCKADGAPLWWGSLMLQSRESTLVSTVLCQAQGVGHSPYSEMVPL